MCFKLKPLSFHIVNGSTLMGFGLAAFFLARETFVNPNIPDITGGWALLGALWFLGLGVYEFIIAVTSKEFFDDNCCHYNRKDNVSNHKKGSKSK